MLRLHSYAAPLMTVLALATTACSGRDNCESTREYFVNQVWGPVMSKTCISCHAPDGQAALENAEFRILPSAYPGFLDANFDNIKSIAGSQYEGIPLLLAKPSGQVEHGGGKLFDKKSDEYKAIEGLLEQLEKPKECPADDGAADFAKVDELDAADTLRKATLHLAGRLPSDEEIDRVAAGGDDELALILDEVMEEDAFYDRLTVIFNDLLLTDRYTRYQGFSVNILSDEQIPNSTAWFEAQPDDKKNAITLAVAREPLDLINYVVRNDRPFTEILTAPYMVFSPFSAELYGVQLGFADPQNPRELQEGQLKVSVDGAVYDYPHAGVLSSPMFLNRFPTTPTNRNRHRARNVFKLFLATDILKIAERPIDPTQAVKYTNPTRDDASCSVCHKMIDPIAGAFQKFDDYDQSRLVPDREWYPEMFAPGYGNEVMTSDQYGMALQWLAERVVADPRFALGTVYTLYRALTGQEPLAYPADDDPDFKDRVAAWQSQDAYFQGVVADFVADNYNVKTAIAGIVLSPYFRGANADGELSAGEKIRLSAVGGGRLSTPELLSRKIEATTGVRWIRGWDLNEQLLTDYNLLYGGIDSDTITMRLPNMSGLMAAVAARMANEVACAVTAYEFTRPADARLLFPMVTLDHLPEGDSGDAVPGAIDDIKSNIQHLHRRILGEALEIDDPEIERTYQLFYDLWKAGYQNVQSGVENEWLEWQCQGRVDPNTNVDLPESEKINTDGKYTIRAWMGVMIYLLSDYRFLYE
ncbi:MAG: DUF1588 domain-containing protein [Nannocystaceae bacterium]